MRVVFDTNIFVSAIVIPGSLAERAILKIVEGEDVLLLSKDILDEILSVLSGKFVREREEVSRVAVFLSEIAEWVRTSGKIEVLKDEPDNRILECAVRGKADIIVTGDKEMLKLRKHGMTKIVGLNTYLKGTPPLL
jgi:putative PIN family toxin of toxin-antitoxin system